MSDNIITATVEWLNILPNPAKNMTWEDHVMAGEMPLQYRLDAKDTSASIMYHVYIEDAGVWTPEEPPINPIKGLMKSPPILRVSTDTPDNAQAIHAWKEKGARYRALALREWDKLLRRPKGEITLRGLQIDPDAIPFAACECRVDIYKMWTINIPEDYVRAAETTPVPRNVTIHGLVHKDIIDKDVRGFSVDWLQKPVARYGAPPMKANYA